MRLLCRLTSVAAGVALLLSLSGCGEKSAQAQGAGAPPPAEVGVVTVHPQRLAVVTELPGRLEATRVAQVRARVPGIVLKRKFQEGAEVKAGQVLYEIDPTAYKATLASAEAALERAEANLAQANLKVQRYRPLVQTNAISKQEFDDALTAQKQTTADVASAKAARETARLNLGYATVTAPISGRIGRALVTEGALVGQGEATPLAVIQQLDPIYATLSQSSTELLQLKRALASGALQRVGNNQAKVNLVTEDGTVYPQAGKLLFSDVTVDETSGSVTIRALFPNPDRMLLPGMFVRARLEQGVRDNVILVPQQAVTRGADGSTVMVVGPNDKVSVRKLDIAGAQGTDWILKSGLKDGERIVVDGVQKARPGSAVKPVPWKPGVAAWMNKDANSDASAPVAQTAAKNAASAGTAGARASASTSATGK